MTSDDLYALLGRLDADDCAADAYSEFVRVMHYGEPHPPGPYDKLPPLAKSAWMSAARAVLQHAISKLKEGTSP